MHSVLHSSSLIMSFIHVCMSIHFVGEAYVNCVHKSVISSLQSKCCLVDQWMESMRTSMRDVIEIRWEMFGMNHTVVFACHLQIPAETSHRCRSLEPVTVSICSDGLRNWSMFQQWWMIRMIEHSQNCFRHLHYFIFKTICENSGWTQRRRPVVAFMITIFSLLWWVI